MRTPRNKTDYHIHRCEDCGYKWQHPDECAGHHPSHTCPKCGSEGFGNAIRRNHLKPNITFDGRHYPDGTTVTGRKSSKGPAIHNVSPDHLSDGLLQALASVIVQHLLR